MKQKITIAIDAMGGDNSPDKTIEGVSLFINKYKSLDDFKLNFTEIKIRYKLNWFNIKYLINL